LNKTSSIESSSYGGIVKFSQEIPENESMALLRMSLEALKPFGPPSPEKLRLIYTGLSDCKYHTPASAKIKQEVSFKSVYGHLDLWRARLRKMLHITKAEPSNIHKSND
jgi:hypothetical protein